MTKLLKPAMTVLDETGSYRNRSLWGRIEIHTNPQDANNLLRIYLTGATPMLMPYVPREIAERYENQYFAKITELRQRYGEDFARWPNESFKELRLQDYIDIKFIFDKAGADKMRFALEISLHLDGKDILVKEENEPDWDSDLEEKSKWFRCRTNEEAMLKLMGKIVNLWLFNEYEWETTEDKAIEDYSDFLEFMLDRALPDWLVHSEDIPHRGTIITLSATSVGMINNLQESPLKEKCKGMLGDFFQKGMPIIFVLHLKKQTDEDARLTMRGPFPYDPAREISEERLLDKSEAHELLFDATVPIADIRKDIKAIHNCISQDRPLSHESLAREILDVLGIPEEEDEFEGWEDYADSEVVH